MSTREQALAIGRVLFSQEVEIIVLSRFYKRTLVTPSGYKYVAVFVPKRCSLNSLLQSDTSEILFETQQPSDSRDSAINDLLEIMEKAMGAILPLVPNSDGSNWIDKMLIPDMYKPTTPSDTQPAETSVRPSCTQKIARYNKVGRQLTGYTPSSEPYTEEHEPEAPNTGGSSALAHDPAIGSGTASTPRTSVVSDSGTFTLSFCNEPRVVGGGRFERGCTETVRLEKKLADANMAMGRLEQRLLDVESRYKDQ